MTPCAIRVAAEYQKQAAIREWLAWMALPMDSLRKKYRSLIFGPVDDLMDEIIRDIAPQIVKGIGEEEIDEDVEEFVDGAREGRFEAMQGLLADPERGQSDDYYAGYEWGFAQAGDWDGKKLPASLKRQVIQEQIEEFRSEVTEQVVIKALESAWSAVNPKEVFKTVMRAVKQHGWKIGMVYAIGEVIENLVIPAALTVILSTPVPPGSLAWLPLNDVVFAVVVKKMGSSNPLDNFDEDGHLDWYEAKYGPVRLG